MQIWDAVSPETVPNVGPATLEFDAEFLAEFARVHPRYDVTGVNPKEIDSLYRHDEFEIPLARFRENYYGDDHRAYWLSGHLDVRNFRSAAPQILDADCILDLGCSSGRTLRHLRSAAPRARLWGADIRRSSIEWLRRHMPDPRNTYLHSSSDPYLPFDSATFDAICAFSVFTHISQDEEPWLLELRRLLKPGGVLYLTFMSDAIWNEITPGHVLHDNYELSTSQGHIDFADPMPERVTWTAKKSFGVYADTVFHSRNYVQRNWYPFFDRGRLIPFGHNFQDVVVLEK